MFPVNKTSKSLSPAVIFALLALAFCGTAASQEPMTAQKQLKVQNPSFYQKPKPSYICPEEPCGPGEDDTIIYSFSFALGTSFDGGWAPGDPDDPTVYVTAHRTYAEFCYGPCVEYATSDTDWLNDALNGTTIAMADRQKITQKQKNKKASDARCSLSGATKSTLSTSDATDQATAAEQLLTQVNLINNLQTYQSALDATLSYNNEGALVQTFTATFGDGGSEKFQVLPGYPPVLYSQGNIPGSLIVGSGRVQACPITDS